MTKEEVAILRTELLEDNTKALETFYLTYKSDIKSVLLSKNICSEDEVHDHFSQAIVVFYDSILDKKIEELVSVKNYLIGICINLNRLKNTHQCRIDKKMDELKLLFYENNDTSFEDESRKNRLIEISQRALHQLNEKCQKIIVGYYIHKWSMKEIAQSLKLSSSDVAKTLKSRCYKKLINNVNQLQNEYQL